MKRSRANDYIRSAAIFFLTVLISGCDYALSLKVNDNKVHKVGTDCGLIEIRGREFGNFVTFTQTFKSGEYQVDTNSLPLYFDFNDGVIVKTKVFRKNNKKITSPQIETIAEDIVDVTVVFNKNIEGVKGAIIIPPCDYIKCNGKPLITDTLRIQM